MLLSCTRILVRQGFVTLAAHLITQTYWIRLLTGEEEVLSLFFKDSSGDCGHYTKLWFPQESIKTQKRLLGQRPQQKQHIPEGVTGQPGSKACWAEQQPRTRFGVYTLKISSGLSQQLTPAQFLLPLYNCSPSFAVLCYDLNVLGNLNGLLHCFLFSCQLLRCLTTFTSVW